MEKVKISIIVPVFNVQEQLKRCIDSILDQTYGDFECILVNDGSNDDSGFICDQYKKQDDRIKVIHQKNSGLSVARNNGIRFATGKYLSFIDSDDYILPNYLEKMVSLLEKNNCDIVKCDYFHGRIYREKNQDCVTIFSGKEFTEKLLKDQYGSQLWQYLFKIELWDNIVSPPGRYAQDMMILHIVTDRAAKIAVTTEKLYFYYQDRSNNTSNTPKNKVKGAFDRAIAFKIRCEFAADSVYQNCIPTLAIKLIDFYNNALVLMKETSTSFENDIRLLSNYLKRNKEIWSVRKIGIKHHILGFILTYFPNQYNRLRRK